MITLYDFPASPHCVRVRLALALAGVKYRKIPVKLNGDTRKLRPFGSVPFLRDGRHELSQSYAALLWIGERYLSKPGAAELSWLAASASELDPPVRRAYDLAFFADSVDCREQAARHSLAAAGSPRSARLIAAAARDEAIVEARQAIDRLEKARAASAFLIGRTPGIADCAAFPSFWLLQDLIDDFPKQLSWRRWPKWAAWNQRMRARFAALLAEADA